MSAITFLRSLYALSFHPGWSISSSGSNLVRRWLQLSKSLICRGNQGPTKMSIFIVQGNTYRFSNNIILEVSLQYYQYLQWTFTLLHAVSLTSESELLLLNALMKLTKLVCLISILKIASNCVFLLLLLVPKDPIASLVSISDISPLWFCKRRKTLNLKYVFILTFALTYSLPWQQQTSFLNIPQWFWWSLILITDYL